MPASDAGSVHRSLTYIAIGSATRSPIPKATNGEVGDTSTSACSKAAREVAGDQRADLLRLPVVGVVVAGRQRVRADHDAALHLGAEARLAGQRHDVLERVHPVVADPQAVAHRVEAGQVRRALAGRDQVVRRQRVLEVRAATPRPPRRRARCSVPDRSLERGEHARPGTPRRRSSRTTPTRSPARSPAAPSRAAADGRGDRLRRSRWSRAGRGRPSPRAAARRRAPCGRTGRPGRGRRRRRSARSGTPRRRSACARRCR